MADGVEPVVTRAAAASQVGVLMRKHAADVRDFGNYRCKNRRPFIKLLEAP